MKKSKIKEPTSQGLTLKQMLSFHKRAKSENKMYWKGRIDGLKSSLRYINYLKKLKSK